MDTGSVTIEAFRFLDIRSPLGDTDQLRNYVIDRKRLAFPETTLERALKAVPKTATYLHDLQQVVIQQLGANSMVLSNLAGGYVDNISELESLLTKGDLSPEALVAEFQALYTKLRGAVAEGVFLHAPASRAWDVYLGATISRMAGTNIDDSLVVKLSSVLRVAAAIYTCASGNQDLSAPLAALNIAAIQISPEYIDVNAIQASRPVVVRPTGDVIGRDLQNDLVLQLLQTDLAARELKAAIRSKRSSMLVQQAAAAPAAPPAAAGAGASAVASIAANPPLVSIRRGTLSATTEAILVSKYGSVLSANSIDNVNLSDTFDQIDGDLVNIGVQLFSSASPMQIRSFEDQAKLLRRELIQTGGVAPQKIAALSLSVVPPSTSTIPFSTSTANASVRTLGIGDLKVVKQSLLRYQPGEVADIENILQGQLKERLHSVKQTTEETVLTDQETTTSSEKDLQTTDRFELSDQVSATISEKQQNEAGVNVSASYGAVSISANTKYSDTSSQEQSSKISRNFARDVVNKSVEKVEQRVREERITKTVLQVEETNRYTLTATTRSVSGVYRWVDKVYWAQVNVYGKRLMLEFMIPEPAAVYLHSQLVRPAPKAAISEPVPLHISPDQITRYNYGPLAASYAAEVENPPPSIQLSRFVARSNTDTQQTALSLPDGWVGNWAWATASYIGPAGSNLYVHIGDAIWDTRAASWNMQSLVADASGSIPLLVTNFGISAYNVSGGVLSSPSDFTFQQWQLKTYKALVDAYRLRQTEYQEYLAEQDKANQEQRLPRDQGSRDIERRELQRACIEVLSSQHFDRFGSISDNATTGWPEIDFAKASQQGDIASFFQQSFEWNELTYVFYPYYWARQKVWPEILSLSSGDALFDKFLTAGFARVVVPVTLPHASDVLFYLQTGIQWSGTEPPTLGDPRYVSIIDEIKESLDAPDGGIPDGDPWQFTIPTSLVVLDNDTGQLPQFPSAVPSPTIFVPSRGTCNGVPYNLAQWKDGKTIADSIRKLGYSIDANGDQDAVIRNSAGLVRAMQLRFNELGVSSLLGRPLKVDGIVGPCTLRALTYFDAMKTAGKWPGVS